MIKYMKASYIKVNEMDGVSIFIKMEDFIKANG